MWPCGYVCGWSFHLFLCLTFDRDVPEQALFLPIAPALSLTYIMTLILQLYGSDGEVQDPAVGGFLEGEIGIECVSVEVHTPAVQLLGLALLILQGLGVKAVPLQPLVGVIVSTAAQGHFLLLQGIHRGLDIHAKSFGDGFEDTEKGRWGSWEKFSL